MARALHAVICSGVRTLERLFGRLRERRWPRSTACDVEGHPVSARTTTACSRGGAQSVGRRAPRGGPRCRRRVVRLASAVCLRRWVRTRGRGVHPAAPCCAQRVGLRAACGAAVVLGRPCGHGGGGAAQAWRARATALRPAWTRAWPPWHAGAGAAPRGRGRRRRGALEGLGPSRPQSAAGRQETLWVWSARGLGPTGRPARAGGVALTAHARGRGQVLKSGAAFRGSGSIRARSAPARLLLTNKVGAPREAAAHSHLQTKPGSDTTVSFNL